MFEHRDRWSWIRAAFAWLLVCALGPIAAWAQPPVAPATSNGTYTVTYAECYDCLSTWLEERTDTTGWRYVSGGTYYATGKASGTYYYRVGYEFLATYDVMTSHSAETRVVVTAVAPTIDSVETQQSYRYETRTGDANGDGRRDLYVERTAGGVAGNGTIERALLLQDSAGRFAVTVPTTSQASMGRSWPLAPVQTVLRDFNADGFVDVLLKGVAGAVGVSAAANQIVYAPGRPLSQTPLGVRAVDATLLRFAANARDYVVDRNYFVSRAPLVTLVQAVPYYYCDSAYFLDHTGGQFCYVFVYYVTLTVRDYSSFDSNALSAYLQEVAIQENRVTQAQGVDAIKRSFETAIGAPIGGRDLARVLGEPGALDAPSRRGLELFFVILGISEANAQEMSPAREGERRPDVVYVTGRRILGLPFLPFHTALEYNRTTISAYDNNDAWLTNGTLVSEVNWASDHPSMTMTLGIVNATVGPAAYWQRLLTSDSRYRDNLPYDPVPSASRVGYNSNGYVHGIVRATGGTPTINLNSFVGGDKPVPSTVFN